MNRVCRQAVVHGRVQGVFFRDTVRRAAQRATVAGWVANRPDGTVEAHLEGSPDAVESVLQICRRGPRGADVHRVEVSDCEPAAATGFSVR